MDHTETFLLGNAEDHVLPSWFNSSPIPPPPPPPPASPLAAGPCAVHQHLHLIEGRCGA